MSKAMLVVLVCTAVAVVLSIILHEPEEVRVAVLSDYRCHTEFQPFDLVFQAYGTLFSTDAAGKAIYRHAPRCLQVAGHGSAGLNVKWLTGITTTPDEHVCFTTLGERTPPPSPLAAVDPYWRTAENEHQTFHGTNLFCWEGEAALGLLPESRINNIRHTYPLGMTSSNDRQYLATWLGEHRTFERGAILVTKGHDVVEEIDLADWAPLFVHVISEDELYITVLTGLQPTLDPNQVIHQAENGAVLHLQDANLNTLVSGFGYPTGIVAIDQHVFVADYRTGQLLAYTESGQPAGVLNGFDGPMGITLAPDGRVCVAEMDGARITCLEATAVLSAS